ncbi:hypothetical protein EX30DRAFT_375463 [Ascodesmis nigricans]|uniref:DUF155 domain-containing protein n=1 Tax=Ascodesmis nigricans TaxID=341454 RepID=A0A4S2MID1_9PEZI|nr:hypothetical protein EX30DRAFT_375463 [Ascodesmis nigricans]
MSSTARLILRYSSRSPTICNKPKTLCLLPAARHHVRLLSQGKSTKPSEQQNVQPVIEKKRPPRSAIAKSSLRRAAAGAERRESELAMKTCTAYCTAEKYDISVASSILQESGYQIDPTNTGLADQVLHIRLPLSEHNQLAKTFQLGDVFIFPTGNIVSWSVPTSQIGALANLLLPAAESPFLSDIETEDLQYTEDPRVRRSRVGGDVIILGTASSTNYVVSDSTVTGNASASLDSTVGSGSSEIWQLGSNASPPPNPTDELNVTLAKIAFSSGLARSTKLAVLECLLDDYLATTSNIPRLLSKGSRLPFTRSFILRKTGELLQFRAQLNLYSELTDSLPDIFWDSRHDLGLEGYYGAVGRALDVDVRIRQLNEKLDYASGIVEVMREQLSERHSLGLEWMIIVLIAVEVGFEIIRIWKARADGELREYERWKERKEMEENVEYQNWKKLQKPT